MDLSYETKNESISKKTKIGQIYCGRYDLEKIPLHGSTKTLIVPKVIEKQHLNNPIGRLVTNSGELHLKKANMWHGMGNSGGSWPPAFPRSLRGLFC